MTLDKNVWVVFATGLVLFSGCGGEKTSRESTVKGDQTKVVADTVSNQDDETKSAVADTNDIPDLPKQWQDTPYTLKIRRSGKGENEEFKVTGALAMMNLELRAYKIFLCDYELDPNESIINQVSSIPEGKTLISVSAMTDYGSTNTPKIEDWTPLKAGDVAIGLKDSRDKLGKAKPNGEPISTFGIFDSEGATSYSVNESLTAEVLYVSEEAICLKLEVVSEAGQQASGIVSAKVVRN